jgi:hypothetical protein
MTDTRTYYAISLLSSRTFWFNAATLVLAALQLTEVVTLIPPRFLPLQLAIVAVGNVWLRTLTVRPAAFIAPGTTTPVAVVKMDAGAPAALKD